MASEGKKSVNIYNKGTVHTGGFYFIAYIGVLIYFLNNASGVMEILFAFVQALVWPGILIYRIFQVLNIA